MAVASAGLYAKSAPHPRRPRQQLYDVRSPALVMFSLHSYWVFAVITWLAKLLVQSKLRWPAANLQCIEPWHTANGKVCIELTKVKDPHK